MPLQSLDGEKFGRIHIFRDYGSRLLVTVALDGATDGQWLYLVPNPGTNRLRLVDWLHVVYYSAHARKQHEWSHT